MEVMETRILEYHNPTNIITRNLNVIGNEITLKNLDLEGVYIEIANRGTYNY